MPTKLIKLADDTLIEVEIPRDQIDQIAGGMAAKVGSTFEKIKPILINICRPIISIWNEISKEMLIESAEVEIGLSFEGEGNLYVTKSKAGANLNLKLMLKPKG